MRKLIIIALLLGFGFIGKVSATGYFVTGSSQVCISSAGDLELISISVTSGTGNADTFWVICDSAPGVGGTLGSNIATLKLANMPANQMVEPYFVALSSVTLGYNGLVGYNYNYKSYVEDGNGIILKNGLCVFKVTPDGDPAGVHKIAVRYRSRKR